MLALWVVLHHIIGSGMVPATWSAWLPEGIANLIRSGYLAVGTFFVLSGFVLTHGYLNVSWSGPSLRRYGVNRLARVYPIYLFSLIVMVPLMLRAGVTLNVPSHVLLYQSWLPGIDQWNTPAWSLSCEVFFYLCFPIAAICIRRMGWVGLLLTAVATCFLPSWLKSSGMPQTWKPMIYLADFLVGMLAARAFDLLPSTFRNRGPWLYLPGMTCMAALVAYGPTINRHLSLNNLLRPLNALIIIGLALGGGALAAWLTESHMVHLGQASYALYILHVPLLWCYRFLALPIHWIPLSLLYLALAIWVTAKAFTRIEEPANRYLRQRLL